MTNLQILFLILFIGIFLFISKKTDLSRILRDKKWQHIFFGSVVAVSILWLFRVSIYDGLTIHFLWLTTLTLVLGFRWAIIAGTCALIISTLSGDETWAMIGVHAVIGVFIPILITYAIFSYSFHKFPRHLFVYIFICAFLPGALTVGCKMLLMSGYFYVEGFYDWHVIRDNYTIMTLLMVLQESFFNGFSITCLVVYKPDLVHTFHDKFYIDNK